MNPWLAIAFSAGHTALLSPSCGGQYAFLPLASAIGHLVPLLCSCGLTCGWPGGRLQKRCALEGQGLDSEEKKGQGKNRIVLVWAIAGSAVVGLLLRSYGGIKILYRSHFCEKKQ
jgi:hypothetical protein